jgi:preprotein translocase subunit SecA
MFNQMLDGVKEETIGFLFRIEVQIEEAPKEVTGVGISPKLLGKGLTPSAQRGQQQLLYSAPAVDGAAGRGESPVLVQDSPPVLGNGRAGTRTGETARAAGSPGGQAASKRPAVGQVVGSGPSRNGPCPCGSGKKYKRCHGAPTTI